LHQAGDLLPPLLARQHVAELQVGKALAKAMNGKGNVAILLGDLANESTRDRTKGVEEVVAKYPNIRIVQKQTAKFTRNDAVDVVSNWMTSGEDIQAIAS
ncbi:substrate-binding domain-containing protein, partial [Klebsiella pneumoniae]|uniref:substrate-binding domain-containing protein n=1 Tax=Klebsiella pneumoniae TaxID=573 RepID=UPI0022480BF6